MRAERCELLCLDLPRADEIRLRLNGVAVVEMADHAKALADPTRLRLALALRDGGELCVCDLAWISDKAENLVGHHLRALREAGLAHSRQEHKFVFYALTENGRELVDALIEQAQTRV